MPKRCIVGKCSNVASEKHSLYKFPKDRELCDQWTAQVKRTRPGWPEWHGPTPYSFVCSDHFSEDCFDVTYRVKEALGFGSKKRRDLLPDAVPTVFAERYPEAFPNLGPCATRPSPAQETPSKLKTAEERDKEDNSNQDSDAEIERMVLEVDDTSSRMEEKVMMGVPPSKKNPKGNLIQENKNDYTKTTQDDNFETSNQVFFKLKSEENLLLLNWNNHRAALYHSLANFRMEEKYTDVTVSCDGCLYRAHKIVLATCSRYFEKIFESTASKHPVIVLMDVEHNVFEHLLNYMYGGETSVSQNDLDRLIEVAQCLHIKGLSVADETRGCSNKRREALKRPSEERLEHYCSGGKRRNSCYKRRRGNEDDYSPGNLTSSAPNGSDAQVSRLQDTHPHRSNSDGRMPDAHSVTQSGDPLLDVFGNRDHVKSPIQVIVKEELIDNADPNDTSESHYLDIKDEIVEDASCSTPVPEIDNAPLSERYRLQQENGGDSFSSGIAKLFDDSSDWEAEKQEDTDDDGDVSEGDDCSKSGAKEVSTGGDENTKEWLGVFDGYERPEIVPFTAIPGPKNVPSPFAKPVEYVKLFFTEELVGRIVDETNKYGDDWVLANGAYLTSHPNSKAHSWLRDGKTTHEEFYAFIGVAFNLHLVDKLSVAECGDATHPRRTTPWLPHSFNLSRFQLLLRFLHFNCNKQIPKGKYNPFSFFKIQPLIDHFEKTFCWHFQPGKRLSVSEILSTWEKNCSQTQSPTDRYNARDAVKILSLRDVETGYICSFDVAKRNGDPRERFSHDTVVSLLEKSNALNCGHHVGVDCHFSSPSLFLNLFSKGVTATGFSSIDQRGLPKECIRAKLKLEEVNEFRKGPLLCMAYRQEEEKPSVMLSKSATTSRDIATRRGKRILRPKIAIDHSEVTDSHRDVLCGALIREMRCNWTTKVALSLFGAALFNAYVLYAENTSDQFVLCRKSFVVSVIESLVGDFDPKQL